MKKFTQALCIFFAALLSVSACFAQNTDADGKIVLRYVLEPSPYIPVAMGMAHMGKLLEEESGGRISLESIPLYQSGTSSDNLVSTVVGTADLTVVPFDYLSRFIPDLKVMTAPFLLPQADFDALTLKSGPLSRKMCDMISGGDSRVVALDAWYSGYLQLLSKDKAITKPADLNGLSVWVNYNSAAGDFFRSMGAVPEDMSAEEAVKAARRGSLDVLVMPLDAMISRSLTEVMRHLSLLSPYRMAFALLISEQTYAALSSEDRAIVDRAARGAGIYEASISADIDEVSLKRLGHDPRVSLSRPKSGAFRTQADKLRNIYLRRYPEAAEKIRSSLRDLGER
jgi:TRAP-type C4-dicarboxylate transport system substrate-binding protein